MGDVVTNYRIRCPYFKSIDRPPFPLLRIVITGTSFATDVAGYSRRMSAGRTLYKDAAAISRPAYPVASDNAIIARERNPTALTNVVDDTPMTRPDLALLGDKNRPNWWPCSGHRPPNIVPFDRPVLTAGGTDSPPPAFENRAVRYSPLLPVQLIAASRAMCSPPCRMSDSPRSSCLRHIAAKYSSASPFTLKTESLRPSPIRRTPDETAARRARVMPKQK